MISEATGQRYPAEPYKIFMLVHDRPTYTYMTLDSLQRATYSPYWLTVFHHRPQPNPNDDVLESFRCRRVIHRIVELTNEFVDWPRLAHEVRASLHPLDEFLFFIESDVIIERDVTCWIAKMISAMRDDQKLAFIGAAIDKTDFIDPEALAAELGRPLTEPELSIIKARSPERDQRFASGQRLFTGHNVPGRFFGIRVAAISDHLPAGDAQMDAKLRAEGWTTGILRDVRHRHMSLQNYYDYPEYYGKRELHVSRLHQGVD